MGSERLNESTPWCRTCGLLGADPDDPEDERPELLYCESCGQATCEECAPGVDTRCRACAEASPQ